MPVNVLDAARHLTHLSESTLSNLQLQKIIYLCHMFFMGDRSYRSPLVHGNFEAWAYGPVHPQLYRAARMYGANPVRLLGGPRHSIVGTEEAAMLEEGFADLKDVQPGQLINITHREGGAWDKNYIPGARGIIIPNEDIYNEYKQFYGSPTVAA